MQMTILLLVLTVLFCVCAMVALLLSLRTKSNVPAAVCVISGVLVVLCALTMLLDVPIDSTVQTYIPVTKYSEKSKQETARRTHAAAETTTAAADTSAAVNGQTAAARPTGNDIVYITKSGKKYHASPTCGAGDYYECPLQDALARGLEPCKRCVP